MRMPFLVVACAFQLISSYAAAQDSVLEKKISCAFIDVNLGMLFDSIGKTNGITFIYSEEIAPISTKVTLEIRDRRINDILELLATNFFPDTEYLCIQNKVIIREPERHAKKAILPVEKPKISLEKRNLTDEKNSTPVQIEPAVKLSALQTKVSFSPPPYQAGYDSS